MQGVCKVTFLRQKLSSCICRSKSSFSFSLPTHPLSIIVRFFAVAQPIHIGTAKESRFALLCSAIGVPSQVGPMRTYLKQQRAVGLSGTNLENMTWTVSSKVLFGHARTPDTTDSFLPSEPSRLKLCWVPVFRVLGGRAKGTSRPQGWVTLIEARG